MTIKSVLQKTGLVVLSCLISLGGIEVALRVWGTDVVTLGNQYVFYRFDPVLGWDNLAGMQGQFSRSEFSYRVKINSSGFWDAELEPKRADEFRVAVLGDSFTWGLGVPYGERFTEVVEAQNAKINVLNLGISGFSPVQYLLQLDKTFTFKPDYIVVAFCLGNDVSDNVSFTPYNHPKPYVVLSTDGKRFDIKGYPLPETKETGPFLTGAASNSRIVGLIKMLYDLMNKPKGEGGEEMDDKLPYAPFDQLSPREQQRVVTAFKLNEMILAAMKKKIDGALGPGRFAVLLVPTKFEMGQYLSPGSDRDAVAIRMLASLQRLDIPAVDGRQVIVKDDFWNVDAHWRPSGHKKIGELLARLLSKARAEKRTLSGERSVNSKE
jgi:lysophospholipase L1-like esterase